MNVDQLVDALEAKANEGLLAQPLTKEQWLKLKPFLQVRYLRVGEPLIRQGDAEREVYFLAEGELEVTVRSTVLATLEVGSVVGEGTFFSGATRSATATPTKAGVAWCLTLPKFEAVATRHPDVAVALLLWLGNILAKRMHTALLAGEFT